MHITICNRRASPSTRGARRIHGWNLRSRFADACAVGGKALSRGTSERGQGVVEMALCLPILLLLVSGTMDFGRMFEQRIAVTNAARDGARYATTHPTAWSNSSTPAINTIEGQILNAGGPGAISNDDSHITIAYLTSSGTQCGSYSASSGAFVPVGSYTQSTCVVPGSFIDVTVTTTYGMITPGMAQLFPSGVAVSSTASMLEEQ